MKLLIVFACIVAIVAAADDFHAKTIHNDAEVNEDNFKYAYEVDNSIKASQSGSLKDKETWVVNGDYEYVSPEGEHIKLAYTADESGYHPDPSSPLIHPIPDYIIRSIEYIKAHPSPDAH